MATGCQQETARPKARPEPAPTRLPVSAPGFVRLLVPALATAGLLWLCYFPCAWGWLGWVALVPLLALVRSQAAPRRIYLAAWVGGLVFFWASLQWLRVADYRNYFTWAALATYCALYFPAAILLLRRLDQGTPLPLLVTVPIVWTALEYARAHAMGGFAWYFLGHTQHAFLPVIQISDLGGAYAVSMLVAAVNALVFELCYSAKGFRTWMSLPMDVPGPGRRVLVMQTGIVVVLLGVVLGYGWWRTSENDFAEGPRVALLQGNLDQKIRNDAASVDSAIKTVQQHFMKLCDDASLQRPRPDLIVWPETSFIYSWCEISPELSGDQVPDDYREANHHRQQQAHYMAQRWHADLLVGVNTQDWGADGRERRHNSAVDIHKNGDIGGRYDKIHCIPFGEYVPFRESLPWMKTFAPYDFDYSVTPGEHQTRFPLGQYHFGVLICYEDTDPTLARSLALADDGPAADFLVNISNDGWFDGTSEHEEHLAICRFRAVESRRAVARAVNMGISAIIDGNGKVVALPGPTWGQSKKIDKVVSAVVPIDHRSSLYARWGDWLPASCAMVVGLGFLCSYGPIRRNLPLARSQKQTP